MVPSRAALVVVGAVGLALLASGARGQEAAPAVDPPAGGAAAPYAGPLRKPPSPTFFPLRPSTPLRVAPAIAAPVTAAIDGEGQPLKALGMVVDPDPDAYRALGEDARRWGGPGSRSSRPPAGAAS